MPWTRDSVYGDLRPFSTFYTRLRDDINLSVGVQRSSNKPAADLVYAGLGPVHLPVTSNKKLSGHFYF